MDTDSKLIKKIRAGDHEAIEQLYTRCKAEFLAYSMRFSVTEEDAVDIYQDSVVTLYENILSGKLTSLSSSVKTYLFAIGKYKIFNALKEKVTMEDFENYEGLLPDEAGEDPVARQETIAEMQAAYRTLGEKCRKILSLFYYENLNIEEIRSRLDYASKDVVKSQKSRCIRQIRDILFKSK